MKAKPEKTMVVVVDKLGYVVPASIVQALRRTFDTARVRERGITMHGARAFVYLRLIGKVRYQHMRAQPERDSKFGEPLPPDVPPRTRQTFVADVLAERLVRKWLRDGYLETVTRGRYRRAGSKR